MSNLTELERLKNMNEYSEAKEKVENALRHMENGEFGIANEHLQRASKNLEVVKREQELMREH